jgi:hypothetical protein
MMIVTTLFAAAIIVAMLYFLAIRFIPWPGASYALVVFVGVACLFPGDVHFRYVGLEVIALGSLLVWFHHQYIRKPIAPVPPREA